MLVPPGRVRQPHAVLADHHLYLDLDSQLAVPPSQFTSLAQMLAKNNKSTGSKSNTKTLSSRLVIEKPFGKDSESCQKMMKDITEAGWEQKEIYRVDHFAAIETASSSVPEP